MEDAVDVDEEIERSLLDIAKISQEIDDFIDSSQSEAKNDAFSREAPVLHRNTTPRLIRKPIADQKRQIEELEVHTIYVFMVFFGELKELECGGDGHAIMYNLFFMHD